MYELRLCVIEYDKTNTTKPLLATLLNVERLSSTYRALPPAPTLLTMWCLPQPPPPKLVIIVEAPPPKLVIIVEMPNRGPSIHTKIWYAMQQNLICHAA